jgi:N-acetylmuramoyl-L-alanine amidase
VIDIKSLKNYKIFPLYEPSRIVIDVWGTRAETRQAEKKRPEPMEPLEKNEKIAPGALAKQLALGVRRVVIDPGHGGKDPGALGYLKNVQEKDVVLDIALLLGEKIESELNCEVIFTRRNNRGISLEERTALANTKNADLFISIHANAHKDRDAYGIETFYLNLATDDESIRVAARENATSEKNISDLHSILSDLMQNAKINESSRLASYIQGSLVDGLGKKYRQIKDNGVKKAPFYVLLGAQMPAVLIETSFISNERECKRLTDKNYQNHLCNGIVNGIRQYIRETSPNALSRK